METIATFADLAKRVEQCKGMGQSIAIVPTMGALHAGHLSLLEIAKSEADWTLATIFVNPTQFAPTEDLDRYPRTLEEDLIHLQAAGADAVFIPQNDDVYPAGFSTFVSPPEVARLWEGHSRPLHFRGVTTVVLKLLNASRADVAVFGQKDFQQVAVIQTMLRDLNHPCRIVVAPVYRDADGLALSSRNRFLTSEERQRALGIHRALGFAKEAVPERLRSGDQHVESLLTQVREILNESGISEIDYVTLANPRNLEPLSKVAVPSVLLIAVRVGATRLIDNELFEEGPSTAASR